MITHPLDNLITLFADRLIFCASPITSTNSDRFGYVMYSSHVATLQMNKIYLVFCIALVFVISSKTMRLGFRFMRSQVPYQKI